MPLYNPYGYMQPPYSYPVYPPPPAYYPPPLQFFVANPTATTTHSTNATSHTTNSSSTTSLTTSKLPHSQCNQSHNQQFPHSKCNQSHNQQFPHSQCQPVTPGSLYVWGPPPIAPPAHTLPKFIIDNKQKHSEDEKLELHPTTILWEYKFHRLTNPPNSTLFSWYSITFLSTPNMLLGQVVVMVNQAGLIKIQCHQQPNLKGKLFLFHDIS